MTIREYIIKGELSRAQDRLGALEKIGAPDIMIKGLKTVIDDLHDGKIKISGDTDALDDPFYNREIRTGRGGKKYIVINGSVNFFPDARYGPFIKRA